MTAQVIEFRPRGATPLLRELGEQLTQPAVPWWTCPSFCDGDCYGGETLAGGHRITREHHKTTMLRNVTDLGQDDTVTLEVGVAARETADGYLDPATVTLEMPGELAWLSADDAEEYAHAILAAVALARQPLPATSPRPSFLPSSGGGRDLNPQEAS